MTKSRIEFLFIYRRTPATVSGMKKAIAILEGAPVGSRLKLGPRQSDQRLRRRLKQAQRTTDTRKQVELKKQFVREFYEGAH